jgi:dynein heavy chain 1
VLERAQRYAHILPNDTPHMDRSGDSMNDPLFRFLEREITVAGGLLKQIRKNLGELKNLAEGKVLATNVLR